MINYSFIIPHHNAPDLLTRCLASIPEREDIQIIVVDDNSKDDLKPCIERKDVEVVYINAQDSKGAGRARNVGMTHAVGKWLLFADCDDYYEEGFLDVLDGYKDKDIDVVYFSFYIKDENGICITPDIPLQNIIESYIGNDQQLSQVKYKNNPPWDKMVKRSFVEQHNMYFEEVVNGNDILFSTFIGYYSTDIVVDHKRLYCYIRNTNSLTSRCQTKKEILCRIDHIIKHNAFYCFIGHPEWNVSPYTRLVGFIRQDITVLAILPKLIFNLYFNKKLRDSWIDIILNRSHL